MTVEMFFANFGHLADAPNGVQKLRELILQLAVQGKLVPQNQKESQPHGALEIARKRLATEKGWKLNDSVDADEKPFDLPMGWCWANLNDTGRFINGIGFNASEWSNVGLPIIRIQNLTNPSKPFNYVSGEFGLDNIVEDGDLLVSWSATLDVFVWERGKAVVNQHIFKVVPSTELVDALYLYHMLRFVIRELSVSEHMRGVAMKHIKRRPFLAKKVAIPPLEEQKRIVAKVDQLMTLCDELEARQKKQQQGRVRLNNSVLDALLTASEPDEFADHWQRICANFDLLYDHPETIAKLRSAILQLAVQGKLVPQDPNDEPASALVEIIKAEKQSLIQEGKIKSPKFIDGKGLAYENIPPTWRETTLGELTIFGPRNGYSPKPVAFETETKSLTLSATTKGTFLPIHFKYVDEIIEENSYLWLKPKDILIQRGNSIDYVGIGAVYHGDLNEFIYPDLMMKIRFHETVDVEFSHIVINCQNSRNFFQNNASGTSGSMPKVNQAVVNSLPFPLPPANEQKRIVAKVDRLMSLCDELEAKLNRAQKHSAKLMEATVRKLLVA